MTCDNGRARMLLGIAFGLLVAGLARADEAEDRAEETVKKLGGSVVRNKQLPGEPLVSVMLSMTDCKDEDLKKLAGLKSMSYLALYRTGITDACAVVKPCASTSTPTAEVGSSHVASAMTARPS